MSHTQTTITAPVTTSDVAAVLAVASHNIGYLCRNLHGKINKWSKYKPVPLAQLFPVRTSDWWRGTDGRCGLKTVYTSNISELPGLYDEELMTEGWEYTPPKGGSIAPFRLGDFHNYLHSATPPFYEFTCIEKVCTGKLFYAGCMFNPIAPAGSPTSLSFEDFYDDFGTIIQENISRRATLGDYYFGIMICKPDGTVVHKESNPARGKSELRIDNFSFDKTPPLDTICTIYPFISLYPFVPGDTDPYNNHIYPLPCVRPATFKVVNAMDYEGIVIDLLNCMYLSETSAKVTLKVSCAKASSLWGYVKLRVTPTTQVNAGVCDREQIIAASSAKISIAANSYYQHTYTFSNLADKQTLAEKNMPLTYQVHVLVYVNNILYEKTSQLMFAGGNIDPL